MAVQFQCLDYLNWTFNTNYTTPQILEDCKMKNVNIFQIFFFLKAFLFPLQENNAFLPLEKKKKIKAIMAVPRQFTINNIVLAALQ